MIMMRTCKMMMRDASKHSFFDIFSSTKGTIHFRRRRSFFILPPSWEIGFGFGPNTPRRKSFDAGAPPLFRPRCNLAGRSLAGALPACATFGSRGLTASKRRRKLRFFFDFDDHHLRTPIVFTACAM
jgi:hypothetical protein